MVELGSVKIYNSEAMAGARVKIRHALLGLGYSAITATRIEAVLSEILRVPVSAGRETTVWLYIPELRSESGITIEIAPALEQMRRLVKPSVMRQARIAETSKAKGRLSLFRRFGDRVPYLDDALITRIREELALKTREELLAEIFSKNEELKEKQELLNAVLENIGSGVYAKDTDGRYIYVNSVWETESGRKREDILGLTTAEIFPGKQGKKYIKEDEQIFKNREIVKCEDKQVFPDGRTIYCLKTGVPMMINGKMIGLCGLTTDISDRKQMEEELREAKTIAENAARTKADFLANMSHEIRTPMNAIVGMTFLMNNTELTEKQKDYTTKILRSSQHLLGIINDILDFSKIEAGKLNIEEVDFNLHVVLENLFNMIGEKCTDKGLELIFDVDKNISDNLRGDPLRLGQVLVNYTNNAVKFTEKGEIVVRIRRIARDGDISTIRFEVQDSGIGLTDEQKEKLFKPFTQADTSTTRKYGGTGLGLVISKQLATLMGGDVGLESVYGEGSTFWFTARLQEQAESKQPIKSNIDIRGRRVLVVDDNALARSVIKEILLSLTLQVDEAEDGERALEMVRAANEQNDPYYVIYMDMQMPGMNGVETWKAIKAMRLKRQPQCILVTAYGREEVFHDTKKAGIEQVVIKPTTPSTLLEATYQAMGGSVVRQSSDADDMKKEMSQAMEPLANLYILLVEDNELNQQVATELISGENVVVDVADNGKIALDKVEKNNYDIVLMDVQMPVMDGFEATRRIRENPKFAKLPVIAMTANAMAEDRERCLNAGMDDFVTKPIDPPQLYATLHKWGKDAQTRPTSAPKPVKPAPVKPAADALPDLVIPELNTDLGLQRILGKKDVYYKILRKFAAAQKNAVTEIEDALKVDDREVAVRTAHTLKGLSGNIGAEALQEKAAALERLLKENVPAKTLQTVINETRTLLSILVHELERQLPPEEAEAVAPKGPESSPEALRAIVEEFKPAVESRKPKQCAEMLTKYRGLVWPENLRADAASLETLIKKYKYKDALAILNSLMQALEDK